MTDVIILRDNISHDARLYGKILIEVNKIKEFFHLSLLLSSLVTITQRLGARTCRLTSTVTST
jgi:hypothetical protein